LAAHGGRAPDENAQRHLYLIYNVLTAWEQASFAQADAATILAEADAAADLSAI
jgi:hypothetical protein